MKRLKIGDAGDILDFSASLNPFPPRVDWSVDPSDLERYPDDTYAALKEAIGRTFRRPTEEICVGNGSIELIRVFCAAVLERGDRVAIASPTFGEYELSARLCGGRIAGRGPIKVHFLCNPNNPTGELMPRQAVLEHLHAISGIGSRLFLDEAFIELADPAESLVDVADEALFVARSLTKSFSVPGLRIGYGFGDADLVERMEVIRLPWTVNACAEAFAIRAFAAYGELARSRERIAAERFRLIRGLDALGLAHHPSSANFVLVHLPLPAADLSACLLARGILVRDCTSFGLAHSIRIAVRTPEENDRLLEALAECLP
ncbi:MAG: histidinol-phosphate transaminase [Methanomicrobiales archaeon]|nr:histidinol-phosphate transaminase [Methanomicrobiales archaeon]